MMNTARPRGRPPGDPAAPQRSADAMARLHAGLMAWWPVPKKNGAWASAAGAEQEHLNEIAVTSGADQYKRPYAESTSR